MISLSAHAQGISVSGTITDESGAPLPGATVMVAGSTTGTVTGNNGNFSLTVPSNESVLSISSVGFKTQEITVGSQRVFTVSLGEAQLEIEEVVVVAYGTARKKDLTGSVSTVDSKLLSAQSTSTLSRSLEGAIPGVQVSAIDGQPGMDMAIRIRGLSSANPDYSNPLVVVDGVAYAPGTKSILSVVNPKDVESMTVLKDAASSAMYGSRGSNGVIVITTKKGKSGKPVVSFEGKWGVNMVGNNATVKTFDTEGMIAEKYEHGWRSIYNNVRYGGSQPGESFINNPKMSHDDAALFASRHLFNYTGSETTFGRNNFYNALYFDVPGLADPANLEVTGNSASMKDVFLVNPDGKINPNARDNGTHSNYYEAFYQKKFRQEYNINISGGTDKLDYYFSGSYLGDPSYLPGSKFDRYSLRSNINAQVLPWLKSGVNMSYSNRVMQTPFSRYGRNGGDVAENMVVWALELPNVPLYAYDENGKILTDPKTGRKLANDHEGASYSPFGAVPAPYGNFRDWTRMFDLDKDLQTFNDINVNSYVEASFLKDFKFRAALVWDKTFQYRRSYRNNETGRYPASGTALGGLMRRTQWEYTNLTTLQTLTWAHDYDKHHIDAIAGHEFTRIQEQSMGLVRGQTLIPNFDAWNNFIAYGTTDVSSSPWGGQSVNEEIETMEGYFGKANYGFDNKYLLTASIRTDGSSKFRHLEDRWGTFWSVGAAWRIINEDFARNVAWLNDLKLRADYGSIGNQNGISRYSGYQTWAFAGTYSTIGPNLNASAWSLTQGAAVNAHLTWEKVHTTDIGLDFRILKRIYGAVDYYQKNTSDMLWNMPLSREMGQANILSNAASMQTRGIELELGVDIITTSDLLWSVNLNGEHHTGIITKVPTGVGSAELDGKWATPVDAWAAQGGTAITDIVFLRGEGLPYYNGYVTQYLGVDSNTGLAQFSHIVTEADVTAGTYAGAEKGDVVPTTDYTRSDKVEIGDLSPKITGGFGSSVTWKGIDFAVQFAYQIGGKFFSRDYAYQGVYRADRLGEAISTDLWNNTFSPDGANANATYTNTNAKFPMQFAHNTQGRFVSGTMVKDATYSDISMFDASYLNVKNITLGYTLPRQWFSVIGVSGVRAYITLDNFWMFTSTPGIDPRMDITGGFQVNNAPYAYLRNASFGLNVTF
jgi:TonB-linked SusC/RagA family outer membrane protein